MRRPNDDFLNKFWCRDAVEKRFLTSSKDIKNKYKNLPKENILNENLNLKVDNLLSRFNKPTKNISETNLKDWIPYTTQYGIFFYNIKTKQWMNNFGSISNSLEDLIDDIEDMSGTSKILSPSIEDPVLPAATSSLDYEVWATTFYNVPSWNTQGYTTHGVVPGIFLLMNSYNGYRSPTDTNASQWTTGLKTSFVNLASSIPESRRVCQVYAYHDELVPFTWNKTAHYQNTSDGVTYMERRFITPWMDNMYNDHKSHLTAVLQYLDANNISIPYFCDDKESISPVFGLSSMISSYWAGNGAFDISGNPTTPWAYTSYGGTYFCDARSITAIINDPRFDGLTNPQTNQTTAGSFVDIYKQIAQTPSFTGSAFDLLSKSSGITHPGDFAGYGYYTEKPYSFFGPGAATTAQTRRNQQLIATSFYAAMEELVQGNYAAKVMYEAFSEIPRFNSSIYSDYEEFVITPEEGLYAQDSNDIPIIKREYPNLSGGQAWYGNVGNLIRPLPITFPGTPTVVSGYVSNPQTDDERYNFKGHQDPSYVPSAGATLVRVANQTSNSTTFEREIAHKQFVADLKHLRLMYRSKPDYWTVHTPWLWYSNYLFNGYYSNSYDLGRYGIEFTYHLLLHGVLYLIDFSSGIDGSDRFHLNNILDTWRNISYNSKSRPCSNATGDIDQLVDRIVLADAFENVAISGGRLTATGKYLWRITAPPSAIRQDNTIVFARVGNDSDIPATVVCDGSDVANGRGIWVKRLVSTPPNYVVVPE